MNKLVLLVICLVASSAFALRVGNDAFSFANGFLKAINSNENLDYYRTCVFEIESLYTELSAGIHALRAKNIQEGLAHIGALIQTFATKSCQISESELNKLKTLTITFMNPKSVEYTGKSLLINNVEVIAEAMKVIESFEHRDFSNLGFWIGKAMHTVSLGLNQPLRQEVIDYVNAKQSSWTAEVNPKFAGMTMAEIKAQYLGALNFPDYSQDENSIVTTSSNDIPVRFNASNEWPGCVHPIRDQGHCGSCWAFAASEVLSDRFCIASKKQIDLIFSPQHLVSCSTLNHGCNGGYPSLSWTFIANQGLVTDSCWPYESGDGHNPKCKSFTKCHDGQPIKHYHSKKKAATLGNPKAIQENLMKFGPVEAGFSVYEDFMSYKGGIYKHTSGALLGGHAVKIIGWGRDENGTDYWIVANSWNTTWGENGFFRIAFGQCGIDKSCIAGEADLSSANESPLKFFLQ